MISCVIRNLVVVAALVVSLVPLVSRVERAYGLAPGEVAAHLARWKALAAASGA